MGLKPTKSPQLVIFGINVPKRCALKQFFLQYLAFGRKSRVRILIPNFTVLALKVWTYSLKIAKNRNFWYKFTPVGKILGSTEKVKYRCTATNLPLCNDAITVLKITLLHSVSVITNLVITNFQKRDKQTKNITLFGLKPVRDPQSPPYLAWR